MKTIHRCHMAVLSLLAIVGPVSADDIDLFVRQNAMADAPNVLFVLDNAANFEATTDGTCEINGKRPSLAPNPKLKFTAGALEQCALYNVIKDLEPGSVNIGIMVYNANTVWTYDDKECSSITDGSGKNAVKSFNGGCLVYPTQPMDAVKQQKLLGWIEKWNTTGGSGRIKASSAATGATMQEAWAHFAGRIGLSGADYVNNKAPKACNNYVIFIGNAVESFGTPKDSAGPKGPMNALEGTNPTLRMNASPLASKEQKKQIIKQIATQCGSTGSFTFPIPAHETKGFYMDEWARYMHDNVTNPITTYTIGFLGDKCQESYEATLISAADVGGGKFYPTRNYADLIAAIQSALTEMLSVNSVFASVSLPISVNTEGTYLNQVYVGMFRPDEKAMPRWVGNLKQYRLGRYNPQDASGNTGDVRLVDARTPYRPAIDDSTGTGFLHPCALSYWTPPSPDAYWSKFTKANCEAEAVAASNFPDGPVVEKGAQGYTLRNWAEDKRNLKTCSDALCAKALLPFDTSGPSLAAISKALLGNALMSDDEQKLLIEWARGRNNRVFAAGDKDPDKLFDADLKLYPMRPSVHGDVVHSRPVAINYSLDKEAPEVVVFYGGNDGVLRAVNGNRSEKIGDLEAGEELWGFIAPESFDQFKRLRDNEVPIKLFGVDSVDSEPKPYGFDGAITALVEQDRKWIFATMRRGGRMVYAFDVSNLNEDPNSAKLLWRLGCRDNGSCIAGANRMGQTWSSPRVLKTKGYVDPDTKLPMPMVIMGGGYSPCEDSDPHSCGKDEAGAAIYVLDASTGLPLKTFVTERPVVADVFVVTDEQQDSGIAKWAYAVDMGGNVYRISGADANTPFSNSDPKAEWTMTKIASLGCASGATGCAPNRKFMFMPDVVEEGSGYVLLVGSGDREKPVLAYTEATKVDNYFFMLRDVPDQSNWLTGDATKDCGGNYLCLDSLLRIDGSARNPDGSAKNPDPAELAKKKGWYLTLRDDEQVVTSAITVYGATTFSTHIPTEAPAGSCDGSLGIASVYNVKFATAAPARGLDRSARVDGDGLPPSPVAGKVKLDTGEEISFIIGANPDSPLEGSEPVPPELTTLPKSITYWYIEK